MAKNDKPTIDLNLDTLEAPEEYRPISFAFRGKRFTTEDIAEIPFEDLYDAYARNDGKQLLNLFLGDAADEFWQKKPSILHVNAFAGALRPALEALLGVPGESAESVTP